MMGGMGRAYDGSYAEYTLVPVGQVVRALTDHGVDHPIVDDGEIAPRVRSLFPEGVDAALELVAGPALPDTLRSVRRGGTACMTGALSGEWVIPEFSPFGVIPSGVRLTVYAGEAADLPPEVFERQLRAVAEGRLNPGIAKVYDGLSQVGRAHAALEDGGSPGKHVVVLDRE